MEEIFKNVFDKYAEKYKNLLSIENEKLSFYPSKGSTGFTERNQSVNFVYAYCEYNSGDKTKYWFEFSVNKNEHIDAIIINYTKKEIIFVEAKRFKNNSNINSLYNDFDRLLKLNCLEEFEKRIKLDKDDCYDKWSFYCLLLADLWPNEHKDFIDDFSKKIKVKPETAELNLCDHGHYQIAAFLAKKEFCPSEN